MSSTPTLHHTRALHIELDETQRFRRRLDAELSADRIDAAERLVRETKQKARATGSNEASCFRTTTVVAVSPTDDGPAPGRMLPLSSSPGGPRSLTLSMLRRTDCHLARPSSPPMKLAVEAVEAGRPPAALEHLPVLTSYAQSLPPIEDAPAGISLRGLQLEAQRLELRRELNEKRSAASERENALRQSLGDVRRETTAMEQAVGHVYRSSEVVDQDVLPELQRHATARSQRRRAAQVVSRANAKRYTYRFPSPWLEEGVEREPSPTAGRPASTHHMEALFELRTEALAAAVREETARRLQLEVDWARGFDFFSKYAFSIAPAEEVARRAIVSARHAELRVLREGLCLALLTEETARVSEDALGSEYDAWHRSYVECRAQHEATARHARKNELQAANARYVDEVRRAFAAAQSQNEENRKRLNRLAELIRKGPAEIEQLEQQHLRDATADARAHRKAAPTIQLRHRAECRRFQLEDQRHEAFELCCTMGVDPVRVLGEATVATVLSPRRRPLEHLIREQP